MLRPAVHCDTTSFKQRVGCRRCTPRPCPHLRRSRSGPRTSVGEPLPVWTKPCQCESARTLVSWVNSPIPILRPMCHLEATQTPSLIGFRLVWVPWVVALHSEQTVGLFHFVLCLHFQARLASVSIPASVSTSLLPSSVVSIVHLRLTSSVVPASAALALSVGCLQCWFRIFGTVVCYVPGVSTIVAQWSLVFIRAFSGEMFLTPAPETRTFPAFAFASFSAVEGVDKSLGPVYVP